MNDFASLLDVHSASTPICLRPWSISAIITTVVAANLFDHIRSGIIRFTYIWKISIGVFLVAVVLLMAVSIRNVLRLLDVHDLLLLRSVGLLAVGINVHDLLLNVATGLLCHFLFLLLLLFFPFDLFFPFLQQQTSHKTLQSDLQTFQKIHPKTIKAITSDTPRHTREIIILVESSISLSSAAVRE